MYMLAFWRANPRKPLQLKPFGFSFTLMFGGFVPFLEK